MSEEHKKALITAGGTGGHVFPAIAVAEQLKRAGYELIWVGTKKGIEASLVTQDSDIHFVTVPASGLRGGSLLSKVKAVFGLFCSVIILVKLLWKEKPEFVLGMGGYVTAPVGLAAWFLRIPLVIHEQNAILGMVNRYLAPLAKKRLEGIGGAFPTQYSSTLVGNPARADLVKKCTGDRVEKNLSGCRILVMGGSQGAMRLNQVVIEAMALPGLCQLNWWLQTGKQHFDSVQSQLPKHVTDNRCDAFITDICAAYEWADLVICRAGAMTVSELMVAGKASILIPYPYAVDNHQQKNAEKLAEVGAAIVVSEADLTAHRLERIVKSLLEESDKLREMGSMARTLAILNSAEQVAQECIRVNYA